MPPTHLLAHGPKRKDRWLDCQWMWCPSPCGDLLFGRVRYRVQNGVVCGAGTKASGTKAQRRVEN
jgi:hypothetical protein